MKSLLNKRLPGILALSLVMLAVGAAGIPGSASAADAGISGLNKKQKKAKRAALRKCNKKRTFKARKTCKKRVKKRFRRLANQAPPKGKNHSVLLGDNYFSPTDVNVKVNDQITWSWQNVGGFEPHNVTLASGPNKVNRNGFISQTTADPSTRFRRQFTVPGDYHFVCSLHYQMTLDVHVNK
jgi:plastocyanin